MSTASDRKVVLVTRRTRLEELVAKYHTPTQAKFYVEHLGADYSDYEKEHSAYLEARRLAMASLESWGRYQVIDRSFLPNFLFAKDDIVVALGQDGLVANTMKYLDGQPLLGVNPEPSRWDGILLPFEPRHLTNILQEVVRDRRKVNVVTMAKAALRNGQTLYAVNDLFVGPKSHTSARYELRLGDKSEIQSSSGLIVSTGLGSTAWIKSIVTGAWGVSGGYSHDPHKHQYKAMPWDADYLQFAVREPFPSKNSEAKIIFGRVDRLMPLKLVSLMPENGVIFSDGIEADFLEFNSGTEAAIEVSTRAGHLVV